METRSSLLFGRSLRDEVLWDDGQNGNPVVPSFGTVLAMRLSGTTVGNGKSLSSFRRSRDADVRGAHRWLCEDVRWERISKVFLRPVCLIGKAFLGRFPRLSDGMPSSR